MQRRRGGSLRHHKFPGWHRQWSCEWGQTGLIMVATCARPHRHTLNALNLSNIASGQTILPIVSPIDDTCSGLDSTWTLHSFPTDALVCKILFRLVWEEREKVEIKIYGLLIKEFCMPARFSRKCFRSSWGYPILYYRCTFGRKSSVVWSVELILRF